MDVNAVLGNVAEKVNAEGQKKRGWIEWVIDNALWLLAITPQGRLISVIRRALTSSWARGLALEAFRYALETYAGEMLEKFIAGPEKRNEAETVASYLWFINELKGYDKSVRSVFFLLLKNIVEDTVWKAFTDYIRANISTMDAESKAAGDDALAV